MTVTEVYPRGCGEHFFGVHSMKELLGLSPLARGTRVLDNSVPQQTRFIHARAGNTILLYHGIFTAAVYPRSRGEHKQQRKLTAIFGGLSPLARGTRPYRCGTEVKPRFIPARAGNTQDGLNTVAEFTVYPRSRGEHGILSISPSSVSGLSPLARGTQPGGVVIALVLRFIPARAGNTDIRAPASFRPTVYPRSRGEHSIR